MSAKRSGRLGAPQARRTGGRTRRPHGAPGSRARFIGLPSGSAFLRNASRALSANAGGDGRGRGASTRSCSVSPGARAQAAEVGRGEVGRQTSPRTDVVEPLLLTEVGQAVGVARALGPRADVRLLGPVCPSGPSSGGGRPAEQVDLVVRVRELYDLVRLLLALALGRAALLRALRPSRVVRAVGPRAIAEREAAGPPEACELERVLVRELAGRADRVDERRPLGLDRFGVLLGGHREGPGGRGAGCEPCVGWMVVMVWGASEEGQLGRRRRDPDGRAASPADAALARATQPALCPSRWDYGGQGATT